MARLRDLDALSAALRGHPAPDADWMGVLTLANQALVTPQLHVAAEEAGRLDRLPKDVCVFTTDVTARNRTRNGRLFQQLEDAVRALNVVGIEPGLLKGAGLWATLGRPQPFDRMLNDLDLLVAPDEAAAAVRALTAAGFLILKSADGPEVHVVAELARPEIDVGLIDLHQRAPGPPGLAADLASSGQIDVGWNGLRAYALPPAAQVMALVLHDQFHEGAFWRGGFAIRHLLDLNALAEVMTEGDWREVDRLARTRLARLALASEIAAASRLAGSDLFPKPSLAGRLHHQRHRLQFAAPWLATPLAGLAVAAELPTVFGHRRADSEDRRRLFGESNATTRSIAARLERLQDILAAPTPGTV